MMSRIRVLGILTLFSGLLVSVGGLCNSYDELPLSGKVEASDLVVIGNVLEVSKQDCKPESACAVLDVTTVLKGSLKSEVVVLFDGLVAEMNPRCCEEGATYLFFLEHLEGKFYLSANGPFGIYRVETQKQSSQ